MEWIVKFTGVTDVAAFASSYEHIKTEHTDICAEGSTCRPHGVASRFMQSSEDPTTVLISINYKDEAERANVIACSVRDNLHFGAGGLSDHYVTREPMGFFTDFWSGDGHY
ncbi:MAG: hypothetical protein WCJ32_03650 [Actinomycetota bacterium]|jgi:hypothetical protein